MLFDWTASKLASIICLYLEPQIQYKKMVLLNTEVGFPVSGMPAANSRCSIIILQNDHVSSYILHKISEVVS